MKTYERMRNGFFPKRWLRGLVLLMILCLSFWAVADGAEFPSKSIQITVPYAPGGPVDTTARILSKRLSDLLGQQIVVVNKPGGGTAIGIQSVLEAPADGYTILIGDISTVTLPLLTKGITFSLEDFIPINVATSAPLSLVVKSNARWNSFEELIAEIKKNPDKITYSNVGPGGFNRFACESLQMETGTKVTQVPYSAGAAAAVSAVLGGHVDMTILGRQVIIGHLKAGTLKELVVLSRTRQKDSPNIPSISEKGYPNLITTLWVAFFVSKNVAQSTVKKLGEVFSKVLDEKEIQESLNKVGLDIENLGPGEAKKFLELELKRWAKVAKAANILPQ